MNHKRIPNLGSKGWLLVAILVLMPIVSIYATTGDTKIASPGVTVRQIDIPSSVDSRYHTVSILIKRDGELFVPDSSTPDKIFEPYFLIEAGSSKYFPDTDDYYMGDSIAGINIKGFYWNEGRKKNECFHLEMENLKFLPSQILYDGKYLAVIGKNADRWDISILEFLPGKLTPRAKRNLIVGEGDVSTVSLNDGVITVIFKKNNYSRTEVKLDVENSSLNDVLITPEGTLTLHSYMAKQKDISNICRLTLRALGSTQLSYQSLNSHADFGTFWALEDTGFIEKGYTRENLIENYSISVFNALTSSKLPDGSYKSKSSQFQIIAVPHTKVYSLCIYGIGTDMNVYQFKNDTPNYWWWIKHKYMKDDPYDFGFNPTFWERVH